MFDQKRNMKEFKIDTHIHTSETSCCGKIAAKEIVHLYKKCGYKGIVITDHYHQEYFDSLGIMEWEQKAAMFLKGYRIALEEGKKIGLNVFLGMEIRFPGSENDYLVFGMDELFVRTKEQLYLLGLEKFRDLAKGRGFFISQAHPCREGQTLANPILLDGVEVYNGNARHDSHNDLAQMAAKAYGLRGLSGSDTHQLEDLGRGGIVLPTLPEDSSELTRMLMENRVLNLIVTQ